MRTRFSDSEKPGGPVLFRFRIHSRSAMVRAIACAIPLTLNHSAQAAILFTEDFSSYTQNQPIAGSHGWTVESGSVSSLAGQGTHLSGTVANGFLNPGTDTLTFVEHSIPAIQNNTTSSLAFKAYGGLNTSRNSGMGFTSPSDAVDVDWFFIGNQWTFDPFFGDEANVGLRYAVPNSADIPVDLAVIVDTKADTVYGTYADGSQTIETPHYQFPISSLTALSDVVLFQDFRASLNGVEIGSIGVASPVPEPESVALLSLSSLALLRRRREGVPIDLEVL